MNYPNRAIIVRPAPAPDAWQDCGVVVLPARIEKIYERKPSHLLTIKIHPPIVGYYGSMSLIASHHDRTEIWGALCPAGRGSYGPVETVRVTATGA